MSRTRDKKSIRYRQFEGGYAQALNTELMAVLEGYRVGLFRRNEVRVFAGRLEQMALHRDSKVSLYRIINCQSKRKGNRRLSEGEIQTAVDKLERDLPQLRAKLETEALPDAQPPRRKPVARKVLRHIARGGATTVEALLCLTYFLRRIAQPKPMQRLKEHEYYARFTYAQFQSWTGVHRATASRILQRIIDRGYLNTLPVAKQNENHYGQLFIDGSIDFARSSPPGGPPPEAASRCVIHVRWRLMSFLREKVNTAPTFDQLPYREKINAKKHKSQNRNQRRGKACVKD